MGSFTKALFFANFWLFFVSGSTVNCAGNIVKADLSSRSSLELSSTSEEDIYFGKKVTLHSKILNEDRTYLVHLPKSYQDKTTAPKKYPILFVLDGEDHFSYASGVVDFMSSAGVNNNYQIPELVVVAITNKPPAEDNRFRDYTPTHVPDYYSESGGGDNFLRFLRTEILPDIESKYRTLPYKVLAGHSMGGLLAVYDQLSPSPAFDAYIVMDPSLWWDNKLVHKNAHNLPRGSLKSPLYLSTYGKAQRKDESRGFVALQAERNQSPFRSRFQVFDSEGHGSLPLVSLYNGLLFIFDGFHPNLNGFVEEPASIQTHFERLSKKLGFEYLPPEDLIRDVCAHTLKEKPEKAVECYQVNTKNYPGSTSALNALAHAYVAKGLYNDALKTYRQSLQIDPSNSATNKGIQEIEHSSRIIHK